MHYHPDEIIALKDEISKKGGAILPEPCESRTLKYGTPGTKKKMLADTCGCGEQTMAVTLYEPADEGDPEYKVLRERGAGFARVCINCDLLGDWPDYLHISGVYATDDDEETEDDA